MTANPENGKEHKSFIDELTELGAKVIKEGEIGYDNTEELKRKIKRKWEDYGGGRDEARKKCSGREFILYWKFNFDNSHDPCRPTAEQVEAALPDELKHINKSNAYDKVTVKANVAKEPIEYTVVYSYRTKVNDLVEKESAAKKKRAREEGEEGDDLPADDAKKAKEATFLAPATLCDKLPAEGQAILENALAGLGYNVDPEARGSLSDGWKRALKNEFNHQALVAFRAAMLTACEKCEQDAPEFADA